MAEGPRWKAKPIPVATPLNSRVDCRRVQRANGFGNLKSSAECDSLLVLQDRGRNQEPQRGTKSAQAEFFASFAPFCGDLHFVVLSQSFLERVLKTGSAGDSPAPVGDPPTGTTLSHNAKKLFSSPRTIVSVPSGGLPDGTGRLPVLPGNQFPNTR